MRWTRRSAGRWPNGSGDTNVLVRFLVADDPQQHAIATAFFGDRRSEGVPGYVSLVVIAETAWVLRSVYALPRDAVRALLLEVVDSEQLVIEQPDIAREALRHVATNITDWIIHLVGRRDGCTRTVTFDRKFARAPGVELLA
jgi:predicted nucleic-acid-binding protein